VEINQGYTTMHGRPIIKKSTNHQDSLLLFTAC